MTIARMSNQLVEREIARLEGAMTPAERIRFQHSLAYGTVHMRESIDPKTGEIHEEIIDPLDVYERERKDQADSLAKADALFDDNLRRWQQGDRDLFEHDPKADMLMGSILGIIGVGFATYLGLRWWFG